MPGALFCVRQSRRPQMLKTANISPTGARHERRAPIRQLRENDMKEKRDYYESDGIEVFDVIEAFDLNFNLGNVMKYICRAGRKTFDPLPDLRKAYTYLEREIERLESDSYDE